MSIDNGRVALWKRCDRPRGITHDTTYVYVTEVRLGVILKLTIEDASTAVMLGKNKLCMPRGIDVLPNSNAIVVADSGHDRIVCLNSNTGTCLWVIDVSAPNDVLVSRGEIFASQWYAKRVLRLRDGKVWTRAAVGNLTMMGSYGNSVLVGDDSGYIHRFQNCDMRDASDKTHNLVEISKERTIDLSGRELDDLAFLRHLPHIHNHANVTRLELWQNQLENDAVMALMQRPLRQLATLWLGHNLIADDGVIAICKAFRTIPSLTDLFLDDNRITGKGVECLVNHIHCLPQMRRIGLHTNRISDKPMKSLVRKLNDFDSFQFVFLKNNPVHKATVNLIKGYPFVVT